MMVEVNGFVFLIEDDHILKNMKIIRIKLAIILKKNLMEDPSAIKSFCKLK